MEFLREHPTSDDAYREAYNGEPPDPVAGPHHGVRLRVGLGAGIVLVLVAGGLAVLITALSPHGAASSSSSASSTTSSYSKKSSAEATTSSSADSSTAFVQVVGQVEKPGLYELPVGDRIVDAIAAAGGFTPTADQSSLNLAQVVSDGQQLVVAAKGAASAAPGAASPGTAAGGSAVDINTADATVLETLDGIGPALAERILAYRTSHGGFRSVGDLQNVTGIGPKKFAAIKGSVGI